MWKMWNVENVEIQRDSLFLCLVILTHCKIILLLTSTLIKQGDARQHSLSVTLVNKVRHGAQWEITLRIAPRRSAPPTQRLGSEKVYFRGFRIQDSRFMLCVRAIVKICNKMAKSPVFARSICRVGKT